MENFAITIARQYGSGGRTVGKMLAEKLAVPFYDKQIIQMASDESGIDVKLFGQVEGGMSVKPSLFNKSGLYKGDLIPPTDKGFISDENLFNYQAKIIKKLAAEGAAILIVTHDVEFAAQYATRCALMFDGTLLSGDEPHAFFAGNRFYTTDANRIASNYLPQAITCEEVIAACKDSS